MTDSVYTDDTTLHALYLSLYVRISIPIYILPVELAGIPFFLFSSLFQLSLYGQERPG